MSKLRPADIVAGVGGLALLITLFLSWYGLEVPQIRTIGADGMISVLHTFAGDVTATAWQAFSVTDVVLALAALVAIALPVVTALASGPAKPVAFTVLGSVGSILAVLLILYRLLNQPGPNDIVGLRYGAWLGLAAALVMLAGCWGALRDDRTPGVEPPSVPRRPPPAA
jgi:hypothetical protein